PFPPLHRCSSVTTLWRCALVAPRNDEKCIAICRNELARHDTSMVKDRLVSISDGVFAVIITIMVLELRLPRGADLAALRETVPVFLAYVLSFVNVAIYWNNHHHLLYTAERINGSVMWSNMYLLFWLS